MTSGQQVNDCFLSTLQSRVNRMGLQTNKGNEIHIANLLNFIVNVLTFSYLKKSCYTTLAYFSCPAPHRLTFMRWD